MTTLKIEWDLRDALRYFADRADPTRESKGTDADLMRQAADSLDKMAKRIEQLERQLDDATTPHD